MSEADGTTRMVVPPPSAVLAVIALALGACAPAPTSLPLELLAFRQAGKTNVALNETLVFHFSQELDPSSVTTATVEIAAADGTKARGIFRVQRSTLEFVPDLPRARDLSDGGLLAGARYSVRLLGFPRPDGLRSRRAEPLDATLLVTFETVAVGGPRALFLDPNTGDPCVLRVDPAIREIGALDAIELFTDEAVDPTTVHAEDFHLIATSGAAVEAERIALEASLAVNRPDGAHILLRPILPDRARPTLRALQPGSFSLYVDPRQFRLQTLGRRPVLVLFSPTFPEIRVVGPRTGERRIEFDDVSGRSSQDPAGFEPESDGTAAWDGNGSISVRFPGAAGDGTAGAVVLEGVPSRASFQATRLSVPLSARENRACDLSEFTGLVVLASQGPIEIAGDLVRRVSDEAASVLASLPGAAARRPEDPSTLSEWLAAARVADPAWTVLISGGDLRVSGRIEIEGPLVLIAGGWIRVEGKVEARELWLAGEGGENLSSTKQHLNLPLDPPSRNPLREPLRLSVRSGVFGGDWRVLRWRSGRMEAHPGTGDVVVRYFGFNDFTEGTTQETGLVDDLDLLEDTPRVGFQVDIVVRPGEVWDPPRLDALVLEWLEP